MPASQIHLAGFLIAGPVVHSHALWRHPETRYDFLDPRGYVESAKVLEEGLFDFLFFADRLAVSDQQDGSRETAFRYGSQDAARLDPKAVLGYLAATTSRIGLGATCSTTYYQPNHVAREFATLDHLSGGRVGWNVVTSMNDSEGRIFGAERHLEHDRRYDRADEFLEVVHGLWASWGEGALLLDRERGLFADPDKITSVEHHGEWFDVSGPLNVPRSPQGRPVIIQAGSSGRGRTFGARWAESIFTIHTRLEGMQKFRRDVHRSMIEQGRQPNGCKILTAVMPFVGASTRDAERRRDQHNALARPELGIVTLSSQLNYDFGRYPLELKVADLLAASDTPPHVVEKLTEIATPGDTLGDLGRQWSASVRVPQLVGTGAELARQLVHIVEQQGADGFVISPAYLPGSFAEFVTEVVPELQRLGHYREAYQGRTLRDHLGLDRASDRVPL